MSAGDENEDEKLIPRKKQITGWIVFDWANSAYNLVIVSTVFPGIFKGAIEYGAKNITDDMKIEAAIALSKLVKNPTINKIVPNPFDKGVSDAVAKAVKKCLK